MSNYTRPNDPDHVDKPEEWLNSALIFGGAVSALLEDNTGVIIDVKGEMYNPVGESSKVIIFKADKMIHIDNFDQDLKEGTIVKVMGKDEE
jgi:hypothetical protein